MASFFTKQGASRFYPLGIADDKNDMTFKDFAEYKKGLISFLID